MSSDLSSQQTTSSVTLGTLSEVARMIDHLIQERERLVELALHEGHSQSTVSKAAGWSRTNLQMRQKRGASARVKPQARRMKDSHA